MPKKGNRLLDEARLLGLKTVTPSTIQDLPRDKVLALQIALGFGDEWGLLVVPEKWMPPGSYRALTMRRVPIREYLMRAQPSASELEIAILAFTRFALLYFLVPLPSYRGSKLPTSVTWRDNMRALCHVAEAAIRQKPVEDGFFARLRRSELADVNNGRKMDATATRFAVAHTKYGWRDVPSELFQAQPAKEEKPRKDQPKPEDKPKADDAGYLPLSDRFVAEAGWRLAWFVENLGASLIECGKAFLQIMAKTPLEGGNYYTLKSRRIAALERCLAEWDWLTPDGDPITSLPFELDLRGKGTAKAKESFSWPPKAPGQLVLLLNLLQMAHLFVFLLSTGGRISEALSLQRGCVHESDEGPATVDGRTYKLVFSDNGAPRDWPIPELGVRALHQQERLAEVLSSIGLLYPPPTKVDAAPEGSSDADSAPLWLRPGGEGDEMMGEHLDQMQLMAKSLGLTDELGPAPLHAHRFRKTIARLIALAIAGGAPKILMDLFGHKSIEMTLHYILSDPAIKSEMQQVAKAQVIMFAENAIREAETNGGTAASRIREAVRQERARLGDQFGESDIASLASTFTLSGKTWQLVRPGVLCTKGPQQSGPCNRGVGHPEPSRCRSRCDHRLEIAALKDDVNRLLAEAVQHVTKAVADDDFITAEHWKGQILANLDRFEDISKIWRADPQVAALLTEELA